MRLPYAFFMHGTTAATNAILEGKGAKTALIVTEGFRDVLHIMRQDRPKLYDFFARRPEALIPRRLRFEVPERILYTGEIQKELDEKRKEMTKPLDESKKSIMDFFRKPVELLESAEKRIKMAMLTYQAEQERIAREAQEKLRLAALKQEEEERRKLEAKAAKQEAKGNTEFAEELREKAADVSVDVAIVTANIQKIEGISTRDVWKFRVIDETIVPRDYLIVNDKALGALATATKGSFKIAGVEFYSEKVLASRA